MLKDFMIPGSYGFFYIGEVIDLYKEEQLFYWDRYLAYGTPFKTQLLGEKVVVFSEPEAYKHVLVENANSFSSNIGWKVLESYFGRGLLLEDTEAHLPLRKFLNPAFHKKAIKSYIDMINSSAKSILVLPRKHKNINLSSLLRKFTLKVIITIVFGPITDNRIAYIHEQFEKILSGLRDWQRIPISFTMYGRSLQAKNELQELIITELRNNEGSENRNSSALIVVLANSIKEKLLTFQKAVEVVLQIFFAGHETTSNLLLSSINIINSFPNVKAKILYEINSVSEIDLPLIFELPYLNSFLLEVQRLFPPVFYIPRGVIEDTSICGVHLPKGSLVHLCPLITHRDPKYYDNPCMFSPNRFSSENYNSMRDNFTYVNFGAGEHYCLGSELAMIEIKIFLFHLLNSSWSVFPLHSTTKVENFNKTLSSYFLQMQ
jgi:retinoid hydroxylase